MKVRVTYKWQHAPLKYYALSPHDAIYQEMKCIMPHLPWRAAQGVRPCFLFPTKCRRDETRLFFSHRVGTEQACRSSFAMKRSCE